MSLRPFHIALPVDNLDAARHFYTTILRCKESRCSDRWIDFNLFGHQLVVHLDRASAPRTRKRLDHSIAEAHDVPVPHFGVVLTTSAWQQLADHLRANNVRFLTEPYTRFAGQPEELSFMIFLDPAGNALEFKSVADLNQILAQ
jgi:extradiol dioxygenase family protein